MGPCRVDTRPASEPRVSIPRRDFGGDPKAQPGSGRVAGMFPSTRAVALRTGVHAGALLAVTGVLAWATGRPFVFPSLGPTAYVLATVERGGTASPRNVLGGHLVGVLAGLAAHHAVAPGLVITTGEPAFALVQFRLALAGTLSVALTAGGMLATDTVHPPACATTLIVSLGLLSTPVDGGIIMASVAVLYAAHVLVRLR